VNYRQFPPFPRPGRPPPAGASGELPSRSAARPLLGHPGRDLGAGVHLQLAPDVLPRASAVRGATDRGADPQDAPRHGAAGARQLALLATTPCDSDLVAATTAAAQREGRAWMAATPHQRWTVTAHDGTRLAGCYFAAPRPAHRTVILIHGHRADASLLGNFARHYRARGFNVFMADNRAHGDSGGCYAGMGWLDHFDYLRWISRLVGTAGPDAGIVLHGISMGGATALLLGGSPGLPPQVRAVISDCSFSSACAEFAYHLRARHLPGRLILPLASQMCRMRLSPAIVHGPRRGRWCYCSPSGSASVTAMTKPRARRMCPPADITRGAPTTGATAIMMPWTSSAVSPLSVMAEALANQETGGASTAISAATLARTKSRGERAEL